MGWGGRGIATGKEGREGKKKKLGFQLGGWETMYEL